MVKKLPKYGEDYKKVMFYDSDKRHADLKLRLQYDGLKQNEFFRAVALKENEIESIFDLLEEEHPDL